MSQPVSTRQDRQNARRAAILEAASEVFFTAGYEGASIDAIIERVGGSKRTLYGAFGSKERLFAAIVAENVNQALPALAPEELSGHDLRSTLTDFGTRLTRMLMSPRALALYRAVVAESARFPELARIFYDNGPGRATVRLAEVLEQYRERGEIEVADCRRAADQFVGMIRDNSHLEVVLGLRRPPGPKQVTSRIEMAVGIFLSGVRAQRNAARMRSPETRPGDGKQAVAARGDTPEGRHGKENDDEAKAESL